MKARVYNNYAIMLIMVGFTIIFSLTGARWEYLFNLFIGTDISKLNTIPIHYDDIYLREGSNIKYVRNRSRIVVVDFSGNKSMRRFRTMTDKLRMIGFSDIEYRVDGGVEFLNKFVVRGEHGFHYNSEGLLSYLDKVYGNGSDMVMGLFMGFDFGGPPDDVTMGVSRGRSCVVYDMGDDRLLFPVMEHEIYHCFGFSHCSDNRCLMHPHLRYDLYSLYGFDGLRYNIDRMLCVNHYSLYCSMFGCE